MKLWQSVLISVFISISVISAQEQNSIAWKMGVFRWGGTEYQSVPFKMPVKMVHNDAFQVYMESVVDLHCYVINENTKGTISVLFNSMLNAKTPLYLPAAEEDFIVANPAGTEKFYIIISALSQNTLDKMIINYTDRKDPQTASALLDEVFRIKQSCSEIGTEAEKPVSMGGVKRGKTTLSVTEFGGKSVYVKTVTIRH